MPFCAAAKEIWLYHDHPVSWLTPLNSESSMLAGRGFDNSRPGLPGGKNCQRQDQQKISGIGKWLLMIEGFT